MRRFVLVLGWTGILLLVGCAAKQPTLPPVPPMPDDLGGWSAPIEAPVESVRVTPPPRKLGPAERLIPYVEGAWMKLAIAMNEKVLLAFDAEERVIDTAFVQEGGEEGPWTISIGKGGTPEPLVHVSVTEPGLTLRVTVTTSKRTYLLQLKSVGRSPVAIVRWEYPPDPLEATKPRLLPDPSQPHAYHRGYEIQPSEPRPPWTPDVVDDGRKTYIVFPRNLSVMEAPMIRLITRRGYSLTNAELAGSVMVLSHLIDGAELRLGSGPQAETVRILRGPAVTIHCPGELSCPQWPTALAHAR